MTTNDVTSAGGYPDPAGGPVQPLDSSPSGDESDGPDESGLLIVGDGLTAPLFEFRASRIGGGRMISPNVVRIWPDRVEEYEKHAIRRKSTKAINYAQVAQVGIQKGMRWTAITVESTGGHLIKLIGVPKDKADRVKALLDSKVESAKASSRQFHEGVHPQVDLPDQIRKLGALRDQGLLTDTEFANQKAKLLG
jgi:hypothetical protein